MAGKFITENLRNVIAERLEPGITLWSRLEGRPRAANFERALRAEVRDPLWMLTRQWQIGEFQGDDAGSPVFARTHVETTRLHKFQPGAGAAEPFDETLPLETQVERRPPAWAQGGVAMSLDLRLLMGRHWGKLVRAVAPAALPDYVTAYPIRAPDPSVPADAAILAHPEAWATLSAVAGRRMDGRALYEYLRADAGHRASDGIPAAGPAVDALGDRFVAWADRLILTPESDSAWEPDRLEYRFACAAPEVGGEKVLAADEYYHGHLDWYSFDVDSERDHLGDGATGAPDAPVTVTTLPTQVTFNGMPNTRWWAFEDGRTSFGDVKPDTTDLAKLLLIEFGLVYANDWCLIPLTVPAGTIATVRGLAVTNVFGERTWVEAAGRGDDDDWQRWAMFSLSRKGVDHEAADLSLVIAPAAQQVLEGEPLEAAMLARDEMANRAWAIEDVVPLPTGDPIRGAEAAAQTRAFHEQRVADAPGQPVPFAPDAKVRYRLMTSVPEHWIPMVPVHVGSDLREIQLQRAAMLRILDGDPDDAVPVEPRTSLLRTGLDETPKLQYFLHEEEVPRAGVRATLAYQRTRWRDGRACVWLGARKQTARGEAWSGLAFDQLLDPPA